MKILKNKKILGLLLLLLFIIIIFIYKNFTDNKDVSKITQDKGTGENSKNFNFSVNEKDQEDEGKIKLFSKLFSNWSSKSSREEEKPLYNYHDRDLNEMHNMINQLSKQENLPDFVWTPSSADNESIRNHIKVLHELVQYSNKIQQGNASNLEKKRYFELMINLMNDKIDFIKGYGDVTKKAQKGDEPDNMEYVNNIINILNDKVSKYKIELNEL